MKKKYTVNKLVRAISMPLDIKGSKTRTVKYPSAIFTSNADSFTFCSKKGENAISMLIGTKAKVVICSAELELDPKLIDEKTFICVESPRLAFIQILRKYFTTKKDFGVSPLAVVSEKADIHPNASIGPHCYIGDSKIGEGCIIYGNVYIYSNVTIGRNVTIHTGTTIGVEDAFAYERNAKGELIKFPHFGGVVIEDDVDIHAHVNIDRGTFGNTIVGKGTKINRYAHVGHNSVIGKHCQIGGQVFIAGSSHIGDYCELALCSCVRNGTRIGKNVMVGMGSVVTKDVDDDWTVYGVPAKKMKKNYISPWRNKFDQNKSTFNS